MYLSLIFLFTILVGFIPVVTGHGCLTKIVGPSQTACAVNAADSLGCTSTNGLTVRTLIARSGNTGECANPPGCEASFSCDWCALEKVRTFTPITGSKWWTGMPAAHWDNPNVDPVFPCMSKLAFGAKGQMTVSPGDELSVTMFINADHSGLYQYQLLCGSQVTQQTQTALFKPITPWLALHKNKDGATLGDDREVGTTKADTNAYYAQTTCTGAGCSYRMNSGNANPDSGHCRSNPDDCNTNDKVTIPVDSSCRGDAILRWLWNSAEGPEAYANCLDLTILGSVVAPTVTPPTSSPTPNPNPGSPTESPTMEAPVEICVERFKVESGDDCRSNPFCCPAGYTCFEKDNDYGDCRMTCVEGVHMDDPVQYQTPWSCTPLGVGFGNDDGHEDAEYGNPPATPGPMDSASNRVIFATMSWMFCVLSFALSFV